MEEWDREFNQVGQERIVTSETNIRVVWSKLSRFFTYLLIEMGIFNVDPPPSHLTQKADRESSVLFVCRRSATETAASQRTSSRWRTRPTGEASRSAWPATRRTRLASPNWRWRCRFSSISVWIDGFYFVDLNLPLEKKWPIAWMEAWLIYSEVNVKCTLSNYFD